MSERLTRRDLFGMFRRSLRVAMEEGERPPALPVPLRPPGAVDEGTMADICLRCGACVTACPRHAIRPLPPLYGARAGTPHVVPREAPCVLCSGLQCTTACPSGALQPVASAAEVDMGLAVVDPRRCLPHQGKACTTCRDRCPIAGAIELDAQGRPRVTDACTGCGLCEYYCPTEPAAIRIRPRGARA